MERTEVDEMEEIKRMAPGPGRDAKMMRLAERLDKSGEWAKYISPPGALEGLQDPRLEDARLKYGIPDSVFHTDALFDRIFVWQLPRVFGDVIEGTTLIKPEGVRQREEEGTPRGVVVSAGLKALDSLRSNGVELGDVVNFIRLSPWKLTMQEIRGVEVNVLILRDGDLIASEELPRRRKQGFVRTTCVTTDSGMEHRLTHLGQPPIKPGNPWVPEDY
jgi:hypothetical protein